MQSKCASGGDRRGASCHGAARGTRSAPKKCSTGWAAPRAGNPAKPPPPHTPPAPTSSGTQRSAALRGSPCRRLGAAAAPLQRSAARRGTGCDCDAAHIPLHALLRSPGTEQRGRGTARGAGCTCSMVCAALYVCVCACTRVQVLVHGEGCKCWGARASVQMCECVGMGCANACAWGVHACLCTCMCKYVCARVQVRVHGICKHVRGCGHLCKCLCSVQACVCNRVCTGYVCTCGWKRLCTGSVCVCVCACECWQVCAHGHTRVCAHLLTDVSGRSAPVALQALAHTRVRAPTWLCACQCLRSVQGLARRYVCAHVLCVPACMCVHSRSLGRVSTRVHGCLRRRMGTVHGAPAHLCARTCVFAVQTPAGRGGTETACPRSQCRRQQLLIDFLK